MKGNAVVKGVSFDGWRPIGDPATIAKEHAEGGADELLYVDVVASLFSRNGLADVVAAAGESVFVPITVAGGIRTLDDIRTMLAAGADKVCINSAAIAKPSLITEAALKYGRQAIVVSIEAKHVGDHWEAYVDGGRERTGIDAVTWAHAAVEAGAGELLVTSVDRDGTRTGLDLELIRAINVDVPVVASGGVGSMEDVVEGFWAGADAVAVGAALHCGEESIASIKGGLQEIGMRVRPVRA